MSKTYIPAILRRQIRAAAGGTCEYCLVPESISLSAPYHIDHIISEKQGGDTTFANLALACRACNLSKGSSIAAWSREWDRLIRLYNPRRESWHQHFALKMDGRIKPLTQIGFGTINVLAINSHQRIEERLWLIERGILQLPPR